MNSSIIIFCITIPVLHSSGQLFLALTNIIILGEHSSLLAEARPKVAEAMMVARTKVFILLGAVRE